MTTMTVLLAGNQR